MSQITGISYQTTPVPDSAIIHQVVDRMKQTLQEQAHDDMVRELRARDEQHQQEKAELLAKFAGREGEPASAVFVHQQQEQHANSSAHLRAALAKHQRVIEEITSLQHIAETERHSCKRHSNPTGYTTRFNLLVYNSTQPT